MKLHPLLHLVATQPHLLAEHAEAYAELVSAEVANVSAAWKRRALFGAAAAVSGALAMVLAGVALMLWGVTPPDQMHAPWILWAVPLMPLAIAIACAVKARQSATDAAFQQLRDQLKADIAMLREVAPQ